MEVHIIFCNDRPEQAVKGDEAKANALLEKLRAEDFLKRRWQHAGFERYRNIFYWHIHTVPLVE